VSVLEDVTLYDLFNAFQVVMSRTTKRVTTIRRDPWEVKDGINLILKQLTDNVAVKFTDLFQMDADLGLVIVVFLGLLELIRLGRIRAFQEPAHGLIMVSLST
jgi:chromatin segregation and condensation protein Rec8/ScpA/Scc1 (kleisin family)